MHFQFLLSLTVSVRGSGAETEQPTLFVFSTRRSFYAVTFAASHLGYMASFAPDAKKATRAAEAIFEVLHRHPQLQPDVGEFPDRQISGEIVFNNLHFRYPTRRKAPVLKVSPDLHFTDFSQVSTSSQAVGALEFPSGGVQTSHFYA